MLKALMFGCSIVLLGAVGTASGQDWTKSKWGPNDEIGAANNLSPDIVVKAAGLIKTGKSYGLGIETNSKTPAYPPRTFKVLVLQPGQAGGNELGPNKTTYNDDIIEGWVGIGSQIDGLGHIGVNWTYYNGLKSGDFAAADGLKKLGVEKIPPIVTRGVLLDMASYLGTDLVKEGTAFNVAEIDGAAKKQGVEIRQGDVVLFHTGWVGLIGNDNKRYNAGRSIWSARASLPSVPIPGRWKSSRLNPRIYSRCTRFSCRCRAPTFWRT